MQWILRNARLAHHPTPVDIGLADGVITGIGPNLPGQGEQEWDLLGRLVLPGLVDAHTHLDKAYTPLPNQSGTLREAIDVWQQAKASRGRAEIRQAAMRSIRSALAHGATAMRSHVNTVEEADLIGVEELLLLREELRGRFDLQLVALGYPGLSAAHDAVMRQALQMGVDCIGSAPALLPDPIPVMDAAFALAEATGKPIDLHIDETENPASQTLALLAERTLAHAMQGAVVAGHCCSLAFMDPFTAGRVMDQVAQAQIHIVTLPLCNLVLMGRGQRPIPRATAPVKELLARGITVSAASDNVQDPFNPFGSYNLLQIAQLTAAVGHLTGMAELRQCLEMVSTRPATLFGREAAPLRPGTVADLAVFDAEDEVGAIASPPICLGVFKQGRLVLRIQVEQVVTPL